MKVAFRVDASARIGGGHVMRCLTLADELKTRGAETHFVAAAMPPALAARISAAGHALHMIGGAESLERSGDDWDRSALSPADQTADAARTCAVLGTGSDWIVVDHYLLGADWHRTARPATRRLMAIDDLANRRLDCDLLLDQTLGRTAADYASLVPEGTTRLLGASFALLRPEFTRERPAALARRRAGGPVRRILLSLGTTDIEGVTGAALEAILPVTAEQAIDVVLGSDAESLAKVRAIAAANPNVTVHVDAHNMAELMRDADLAIGAAGTTSWERCCLGLPTVTLTLAANQTTVAAALKAAGAGVSADRATLAEVLGETIDDETGRAKMSAAAFAIVDGLGVGRVVEKLTGQDRYDIPDAMSLRPATASDSERLWLWRNDPETRAASRSDDPVRWQEHEAWLATTLNARNRLLQIAQLGGEPVAMVRFDEHVGRHEISINIRPDRRGAGLGGAVVETACTMLESARGPTQIVAVVHEANPGSQRMFERCGFTLDNGGNGPFRRYVRPSGVYSSRKSA